MRTLRIFDNVDYIIIASARAPGLNKSMKLGAIVVFKLGEETFVDQSIIYLER